MDFVMRLFNRQQTKTVERRPAPIAAPKTKPGTPETVTDNELVALCGATCTQNFRDDEMVVPDLGRTDSYLYVVDGCIQLTPVRVTLKKGDCIGQVRLPGDLPCPVRTLESATVITIPPSVFSRLPLKAQFAVLNSLGRSTARVVQQVLSESMSAIQRTSTLSALLLEQDSKRKEPLASHLVNEFLTTVPKLPVHAMSLAEKLLREDVSVQDVLESIRTNPSLAAIVLKAVNSAEYGFPKKIETFYHACMILGFDNIYQLIIQDALQTSVPALEESREIHIHSCLVSAVASEIVALANHVQSGSATTSCLLQGLLHDVGKSVLLLMKQKYPGFADLINTLDEAKIGADLLRRWDLPERTWQVIELQKYPEFAPPEAIPAELRKDVAILYLAHLCASFAVGEEPNPHSMAFIKEYMSLLQLRPDIHALWAEKIMPALVKKRGGLPAEVRDLLDRRSALAS